jgi:adhesin/invasin
MRKISLISLCILVFSTITNISSANAQGQMTTWIGTGISGYSGDGGPANLAAIGSPYDVRFDAAGNFYFVDHDNNVIRRVDAVTNIITTVAGNGYMGYSGDGGLAVNALLAYPTYLCIDHAGNIYFSDGGCVIRKINKATGIITTVAVMEFQVIQVMARLL